MNEGYVKVSWENNAKTGAVENIAIDTEASAMEEATPALWCATLVNPLLHRIAAKKR